MSLFIPEVQKAIQNGLNATLFLGEKSIKVYVREQIQDSAQMYILYKIDFILLATFIESIMLDLPFKVCKN